jgi:hypothetical protein
MTSYCISGGAKGADTVFAQCAWAAGHLVSNMSFKGHYCSKNPCILDQNKLNEADPVLKQVNTILKRTFPSGNLYVDNLLRRNRFQVQGVNRVYAVTSLDGNGIPFGGTAWAVLVALDHEKMKEVYVYDMKVNHWVKFCGFVINPQTFYPAFAWRPISYDSVSRPDGIYTGIGSRELSKDGENAIRDLYR